MKTFKAVYLGAIGGAGALISRCIRSVEVVAYDDLGAEALRRIIVKDFPATVINDIYGGDMYEEGRVRYRRARFPCRYREIKLKAAPVQDPVEAGCTSLFSSLPLLSEGSAH